MFTDPIEAAKKYDEMALKLYGKNAYTNFTNKRSPHFGSE
jgi:hypothetical protein